MAKGEGKVVAQNKKARHDYTIVDTIEAGMVLTGTEIKSVRAARINLKDGFAQIKNGEAWLSNVHIAPYEEGNIWNQEPERRRKLLLHKKQIQKLEQETKGTGMTLVPLKVYQGRLCQAPPRSSQREARLRQARVHQTPRAKPRHRKTNEEL